MSFFQSLFGAGGRPVVDGSKARELVSNGAQLVDVRSPGEFAGGAIPGAKNIPVDQIGQRARELDKSKAVVLYCRSGARSASAAGVLKNLGFDEVYDLGPMGAW